MAKAFSNKVPLINGYLDELTRRFKYTNSKGTLKNIDKNTAFEVFSTAIVLGKSFQDVRDNVQIRGKFDGGIDGIYFERVDNYSIVMHVFQCKNTKKLTQNELEKFRNDFKDIFIDGNVVDKPNIQDLKGKIEEYQQLTNDLLSVTPKLYFLYNGENDAADYANNINLYQNYHMPNLGFEIWDSEAIYDKISAPDSARVQRKTIQYTFQPAPSTLVPNDIQDVYSYSIGDVRAINFRIDAIQLCLLIEQEIKTNKTDSGLFSANIRAFLGDAVKANRKMKETLSQSQEAIYFPFLNNGITIICEKLSIPLGPQDRKYLVPTLNPVIVNGLQTSKVLHQTYMTDRTQLKGIYVNIRIYETKDPELVEKITDATNTQSPIYYKDKVSNKDFNKWAQELFQTKGIFYLTKRGEIVQSLRAKQEQIDNDLVLKFWFATYYEQPEMAKSSKAAVLEITYEASNGLHALKQLFSGDKESALYVQLVITYFIYKSITTKQELYKAYYPFIGHAKELLCYGVYKAMENNLAAAYQNDIDTLDSAYQIAINYLSSAFNKAKQEYKNNNKFLSIPGYFKSAKSRIDYNREAGILETQVGLIDLLLQKRL